MHLLMTFIFSSFGMSLADREYVPCRMKAALLKASIQLAGNGCSDFCLTSKSQSSN
jgi:hypothetical protein